MVDRNNTFIGMWGNGSGVAWEFLDGITIGEAMAHYIAYGEYIEILEVNSTYTVEGIGDRCRLWERHLRDHPEYQDLN